MCSNSESPDTERSREGVRETGSDLFEPFRKALETYAPQSPAKRARRAIGKRTGAHWILVLVGLTYGGYRYFAHRTVVEARRSAERQDISNMAIRRNAFAVWREKLEQLNKPTVNDVRETLTRDGHPLLLSVGVPQIAEIGK